MASRGPPHFSSCSPPLQYRLRCSYRIATLAVCGCNVVAALYLLHSFLAPLFLLPATPTAAATAILTASLPSSASSARYSEEQMNRMKQAVAVWRAAKPIDLIKRVEEIQQESAGGTYAYKPAEVAKGGGGSGLAQRLKELRDPNNKSEQEALEEWRRKKLEDARKRAESIKAKQEEYLDSLKM